MQSFHAGNLVFLSGSAAFRCAAACWQNNLLSLYMPWLVHNHQTLYRYGKRPPFWSLNYQTEWRQCLLAHSHFQVRWVRSSSHAACRYLPEGYLHAGNRQSYRNAGEEFLRMESHMRFQEHICNNRDHPSFRERLRNAVCPGRAYQCKSVGYHHFLSAFADTHLI